MYTLENTVCSIWFERDRAHVCLMTADESELTIFELWDTSVAEFCEDGFKSNKETWHQAMVNYANEHRMIPK